MTDTADTLTIREMCAAFDVSPRTLRFYETKELLSPIRARLRLILRGKRFGFLLEEIRQLLDMYDRDGSNEAQLLRTYDIAKDRLAQMEAQRAELDVAIADLKTQLAEGEKALAAFRNTASAA